MRKPANSSTPQSSMNSGERTAALSLSSIYALRMMGLFMILPVFSLYAHDHLAGATPLLIGLAIGIYGLANAVFQIPFGMLSDRFGRKPIIVFGLLLFAIGSVVAALSDTITGVIIGRAIQGSGAIAAAVMALAADLTREEHRLKIMAMIGMTIGLSFSSSLVLGPLLNDWIGVPGIFWLTAVLALAGIGVLHLWVPQPVASTFHRDAEAVPAQFTDILKDTQLLRLNFGIFALHLILTASFVVVPLALRDHAGLAGNQHWIVYLGVQLLSMAIMVPFIIYAEKYRHMKQVFFGCVVAVALAQAGLGFAHTSVIGISLLLLLFFIAFNVLEATLPSLIAKTAPSEKKGTAMGVYTTTQFLGAFTGGIMGGWLYGAVDVTAVFAMCAGVATVWAVIAASMREPRYLSNHLLKVSQADAPLSPEQAQALAQRLRQVRGVAEATVIAEDGIAYLKVDTQTLDNDALGEFSVAKA